MIYFYQIKDSINWDIKKKNTFFNFILVVEFKNYP